MRGVNIVHLTVIDLQYCVRSMVGPMVCRLMKGAFQLKPPKPKYTTFWSVDGLGRERVTPLQVIDVKTCHVVGIVICRQKLGPCISVH